MNKSFIVYELRPISVENLAVGTNVWPTAMIEMCRCNSKWEAMRAIDNLIQSLPNDSKVEFTFQKVFCK